MKKLYKAFLVLFLNLSFFGSNSFSQSPLAKQWDYRFGGSADDYFTCLLQTNDGGYVIGGWSGSPVSGDKSQPPWGTSGFWDFWIIKTDKMGIKQWDKRYGGTGLEELISIQQTKDGGYILAGTTGSFANGDKSSPNYGYYDYWLLKIDSLGVKQWDNDFGGPDEEDLLSVQQTADGGYILGGYSFSYLGGNKTSPNWDGSGNTVDYWIVKTDSLGNKQWDKDLGGTEDDMCVSIVQTADGGYLLGGTSNSGISGNKTQATWGGANDADYWMVKIDSSGNFLWDKDLGGIYWDYLHSIQLTPDGGFIIGGSSGSPISGDKSQNSCAGLGDYDYWIIKTDSLCTVQWDKDLGGSDYEDADAYGNIFLTHDGGYLFSGMSHSPVSCDKSEANLGPYQNWVVKIDSAGNKQWDKTALFPDNLQYYQMALAIESTDSCYVFASFSTLPAGGDKTQTGQGGLDYWFIKFCDSTAITSINQIPQLLNYPITISPNPSNGIFQITFPSSSQKTNYTLEVLNTLGQTVFSSVLPSSVSHLPADINLSFLPKGIYVLRINDGTSALSSKFVIE